MRCGSPHSSSDAFPRIACAVSVRSCREIAPAVYEIVVDRAPASGFPDGTGRAGVPAPEPGQFYMLRARPSAVLLGRPISVYLSDESSITFLILKKGRGTAELCGLRAGDALDLVGPIGNRFVPPAELAGGAYADGRTVPPNPRVALIGGGIGVAPVAGFSLSLPAASFDFYASFRTAPYGLDRVSGRAASVFVTTEDGSAGVRGMLPAVFEPSLYDLVYACGPTPMLRYVKETCAAPTGPSGAGPIAFLSLEEHMACGAGACLGCTVRTVNGNRRCCVDGPVFDSSEVLL